VGRPRAAPASAGLSTDDGIIGDATWLAAGTTTLGRLGRDGDVAGVARIGGGDAGRGGTARGPGDDAGGGGAGDAGGTARGGGVGAGGGGATVGGAVTAARRSSVWVSRGSSPRRS